MGLMNKLAKFFVPAALVLAAGCQVAGDMEGRPADEFLGVDEETAVTRLANTQVAAGARTDSTLRPYHFSEGALNSLGREKLDFIVMGSDNGSAETVIYLDVPAGDDDAGKKLAEARHDAVNEYLLNSGLSKDSFRLKSGFNPNNTTSAALPSNGSQDGDDTGMMKANAQDFGQSSGNAFMDSASKK